MSRFSRKIVATGSLLVLAVLTIDAVLVLTSLRTIAATNTRVDHTRQVINAVDSALSVLKDAETGQRGYLLTGRDDYLEPFRAAEAGLGRRLESVRSLTVDNPRQQVRVSELQRIAAEKMAELRQTIALRREAGLERALEVVLTDRGKKAMERTRQVVAEMREDEDVSSRIASGLHGRPSGIPS